MTDQANSHDVVGRSVPRKQGREKVTGGENYPVNFELPGMLHGAILRSSRPHANVKHLDVEGTGSVAGVHAVLTPTVRLHRRTPPLWFGICML